MDMSDLFKRHLVKLHKGNNLIKTVQDRKEHLISERRSKRETLTNARRNIDLNMSPYTPIITQTQTIKENKSNLKKESAKNTSEGVNKRLELLAKWKAERAKQKEIEKAKKKPVFKVCHVSQNLSVNLENGNKGPSSVKKPQFAPDGHKFRPPKGIRPLNFSYSNTKSKAFENPWKICKSPKTIGTSKPGPIKQNTPYNDKPILDNKVSKNKASHSKRQPIKEKENLKKQDIKTKLSQSGHTNCATKALENSRVKTEVKTVSAKSTVATVSKNRQTPVATTSKKKLDTSKTVNKSSKNNIKELKKTVTSPSKKKTSTNVNRPSSILRSVEKEGKLNEESSNNKIEELPNNKTEEVVKSPVTPVYVSPFVTISRGKRSAREEFMIRNSYGKEVLKQASPEKLNLFNSYTSPQAGADYFMAKLDSETDKINKMCEEWENYLEEPQLPDEAKSSIDVAIGQSKLLISKKFKQFRGLIVQCKTKEYEEKDITCEDLHGFWDMVYMQVQDLDRRFANLEKLKQNNWEELLPEKKAPVRKTRARPKKATGTSRLKDIIKAAREKQNSEGNTTGESEKNMTVENKKLFNGGYFEVRTPVKEEPSNAGSNRKNLRVSLLTTNNKKRASSSPGLTLMKISQSIKQGNGLTPAKSILKSGGCKSTGKKSVVFKNLSPTKLRRTVLFNEEKKEILRRSVACNEEEKENTPNGLRRSSRLAKCV